MIEVLPPDMPKPRPAAKVSTVALLLECDESDVRRMVRSGELEAHLKGKRGIRIYLDSVVLYQESRTIRPKAGAPAVRAQRATISRTAHAAAEAALRKSGILR